MGYDRASILMYGIAVSEEVAQRLYERFYDENSEEGITVPRQENYQYYRRLRDWKLNRNLPQKTPLTPYPQHDARGKVFYPLLVSEGADSRVDNMLFNEGFDHYFGIFIASKGYGHEDNTNFFRKNPPREAIEAFNNLLDPILKERRVTSEAGLIATHQTW